MTRPPLSRVSAYLVLATLQDSNGGRVAEQMHAAHRLMTDTIDIHGMVAEVRLPGRRRCCRNRAGLRKGPVASRMQHNRC